MAVPSFNAVPLATMLQVGNTTLASALRHQFSCPPRKSSFLFLKKSPLIFFWSRKAAATRILWAEKKKKSRSSHVAPAFCIANGQDNDYLPWCSLDTVRDLRPFLRRADNTRRPLAVCIRRRKPCLLILFLL